MDFYDIADKIMDICGIVFIIAATIFVVTIIVWLILHMFGVIA